MHQCEPKSQSTDCLTKEVMSKKQHYQRVWQSCSNIYVTIIDYPKSQITSNLPYLCHK